MSFRHVTLTELPIDERPIDRTHLKGINFTIDSTWDGKPLDHDAVVGRMEWMFQHPKSGGQGFKAPKRVIKVTFEAPLFEDPEPDEYTGILLELLNYNAVEFFFANAKNQYLEVAVGPHGHWLCKLHDGYRIPFNRGEQIELAVTNLFKDDKWHCSFELPIAYLPPKVTKFNAYSIHGTTPNRMCDALYPLTDGNEENPDCHKLEYFRLIDMRRLIPSGFNADAVDDPLHGDMWKEQA